jgi:hypothetical protein
MDVQIRRRTDRLAVRSPDIDGYLPKAVIPVLYERWKTVWGSPVVLHGGISSITCDMVKDVGFQKLSRIYGVRRAKLFMDAAQKGAI